MPLLDHFHPPLSGKRHWESFHAAWATALADNLNEKWLPDGYVAEETVTIGGRVEIDVATWDERESTAQGGSPAATLTRKIWTPPAPTQTMPGSFPDSISVQVLRTEGGPTLVAEVELVSPSNKDRAEHRRAFAMKCGHALHRGIGLVIVDIVTSRHANLHDELIELLQANASFRMPTGTSIYAAAYHPLRRDDRAEIDLWKCPLALGDQLPTMPLGLSGVDIVPLELDSTYRDVCRRRLID
jgi:hypothetical protein